MKLIDISFHWKNSSVAQVGFINPDHIQLITKCKDSPNYEVGIYDYEQPIVISKQTLDYLGGQINET